MIFRSLAMIVSVDQASCFELKTLHDQLGEAVLNRAIDIE